MVHGFVNRRKDVNCYPQKYNSYNFLLKKVHIQKDLVQSSYTAFIYADATPQNFLFSFLFSRL